MINYTENTDKFFDNISSLREKLVLLYSFFTEQRALGFEHSQYSESFVLHLASKFTCHGRSNLSEEELRKFNLYILKYIDDAYRSTNDGTIIVEEPKAEIEHEFEDERDLIPDKQIDWEFMKMIGMEHPDE